MGERRVHLLARRKSFGRSSSRQTRLLDGLRRHGGLFAGWRCRKIAGGMDHQWRARGGCLRHGRRALRRLCREQTVHQRNHRPVLFAPFYNDLSERAIASGTSFEDGTSVFRYDRGGMPVGAKLGPRSAALFRGQRVRRNAVAQTLKRVRHCRC